MPADRFPSEPESARPERSDATHPGESSSVIESEALLRGSSEVRIRHGGRLYRLRRTRLGKLILTA